MRGKLVVSVGVGNRVSVAAARAGAVSLLVDANKDAVKTAFRRGEIDFIVYTLDEALRILKNELRQGRGLVVALVAEPMDVAAAFRERGVLADVAVEAEMFEARERAAVRDYF